MAGSVNKVILIGNLGRDPEIRSMQDGREVANLAIATSESWKDKNTGEKREKTEWHRVTVFNPGLVNITKQYLKKGSKVFVEGALQTRKWQDQSGQDRYTTEIVLQGYAGSLTMLDNKSGSSGGAYGGASSDDYSGQSFNDNGSGSFQNAPQNDFASTAEALDDDIPF